MGPLGWQETLIIFVLALLLFGPKELPKLGKTIAKAMGEFRRASGELKDTWHREMANLEQETQDIHKEVQSAVQATNEAVADTTTPSYDSSYDYGAYGYPESYDASGTPTTDSSPVSASATQDADSTAHAAVEVAEAAPTPVSAEGAVPTGTSVAQPPTPSPAEGTPAGS